MPYLLVFSKATEVSSAAQPVHAPCLLTVPVQFYSIIWEVSIVQALQGTVADSETYLRHSALKAKLAKYRAQLLEPDKKSGGKGEGFDVLKSGGEYHS